MKTAKLMRFYGLSLVDCESLTAEAATMLWEAITAIEAQETLVAMRVSAVPNMKKNDVEKFHRALHRMAYPSVYEQPVRVLTAEQAAVIFNGN